MMTLWNYLIDFYNSTSEMIQNTYYYLKDYVYGYHDTWLFISGHTIPISLNNVYKLRDIDWVYDNFDNTLTYIDNNNDDTDNKDYDNEVNCRLSWLSAKINITNSDNINDTLQYDIDDFIEKLSVHTRVDNPPSLYIIFMCWCAYTKYWFKLDDIVEFNVIDDMGDENIFTFDKHNKSFNIKRKKLYIVIHNEEDNKTENDNDKLILNKEEEKEEKKEK